MIESVPVHEDVKLGLSIAWQRVPFQEGGWADWTWEGSQQKAYDRLLEPDKRFQVCGDQVSYLPGWQEGAVLSAHHVVEQIAGIRRAVPQLKNLLHTRVFPHQRPGRSGGV